MPGNNSTFGRTLALLLSGRRAGLFTYIYTVGSLCLIDLTEIVSPMIMRVNNDVTLGPYMS